MARHRAWYLIRPAGEKDAPYIENGPARHVREKCPLGIYELPFSTSGLVHPYHLDESISSFSGFLWMLSFLLYFA